MAWPEEVSRRSERVSLREQDRAPSEDRPAAPPGDRELVERALSGDRQAEEAIFCRYVREITAMALRMLGDRTEAEDVAQDTFLAVLAELRDLRDPAALRGWIRRVAVRKIHRRFRRRRMLRTLGLQRHEGDLPLDALASGELSPELRAELARLSRALDELPGTLRVAWLLRHVEGCSLQEAADAAECSLATVKRRIGQAASRLREHVDVPRLEEDHG